MPDRINNSSAFALHFKQTPNMKNILAVIITCIALAAQAKEPLRIIVPFGPGGVNDIIARNIEQGLTDKLGRSIYVDNKPGANGLVGTLALKEHKGSDLVLMVNGAASFVNTKSVDGVSDMTPIYYLGKTPIVVCAIKNHSFSAKQLFDSTNREFITYGVPGEVSSASLAMGYLQGKTKKLNLVQVPYKSGASLAITDAIGGHIDLVVTATTSVSEFVTSGRLSPIMVLGKDRSLLLPSVPRAIDLGLPTVPDTNAIFVFANKSASQSEITEIINALDEITSSPGYKKTQNRLDLILDSPNKSAERLFVENKKLLNTIYTQMVNAQLIHTNK